MPKSIAQISNLFSIHTTEIKGNKWQQTALSVNKRH
jgi:hypothetical protein